MQTTDKSETQNREVTNQVIHAGLGHRYNIVNKNAV